MGVLCPARALLLPNRKAINQTHCAEIRQYQPVAAALHVNQDQNKWESISKLEVAC